MTRPSSLKDKIRTFSRYGLACLSLGMGGMLNSEVSPDSPIKIQAVSNKYDSLVDKTRCADASDIPFLLDVVHMASETKSGRELLEFLTLNGGKIFSQKMDEKTTGMNAEMDIMLNPQLLKDHKLQALSTLLHECEHARHNQIAQKYGITKASFSSYEDQYIYLILKESLAYRASQLGITEYQQKYAPLLGKRTPPTTKANRAFYQCFLEPDNIMETTWYEASAMVAHKTNPQRPNYKPDWSALASLLSQGQIQHINQLPLRDFCSLNRTFEDYLKQNPKIDSISHMKLDTFRTHKEEMLKDPMAFKTALLAWLPDTMAERYLAMDWTTCSHQDFLKIIQKDLQKIPPKNRPEKNIVQAQKVMNFYENLFFPKKNLSLTRPLKTVKEM